MKVKSYRYGLAAIVIVPLAVYIGSYFVFTEVDERYVLHYLGRTYAARICKYEWMTNAYEPLVSAEQWLTGRDVMLTTPIKDP